MDTFLSLPDYSTVHWAVKLVVAVVTLTGLLAYYVGLVAVIDGPDIPDGLKIALLAFFAWPVPATISCVVLYMFEPYEGGWGPAIYVIVSWPFVMAFFFPVVAAIYGKFK